MSTRIVSLLPAGTEIVHALGAGDELVGRSHECDFPAGVEALPVVSRPALQLEGLPPAEVDRAVAERLRSGESLYHVDEVLLWELAPELIITQDLCQVCAPSGNELTRAIRDLPGTPRVLRLTPQTIAEIYANIVEVGQATGRVGPAEALVVANRRRVDAVVAALDGAPIRPTVFLEWIAPFFSGGHWVPEMIALAGGRDPLGHAGSDSERVSWEAVLATRPEVVFVAPCGYRLEPAEELARTLPPLPGATVHAVDANAYFARPGPRVAEGVELLAHLLHPERFTWPHASRPWTRIV